MINSFFENSHIVSRCFRNKAERNAIILTSLISLALIIFAILAETKVFPGASSYCTYTSLAIGTFLEITLIISVIKKYNERLKKEKDAIDGHDLDEFLAGIKDIELRKQAEVAVELNNEKLNPLQMDKGFMRVRFINKNGNVDGFSVKLRKERFVYCYNYHITKYENYTTYSSNYITNNSEDILNQLCRQSIFPLDHRIRELLYHGNVDHQIGKPVGQPFPKALIKSSKKIPSPQVFKLAHCCQHILSFCDFTSLLSMRQTCQVVYESSNAPKLAHIYMRRTACVIGNHNDAMEPLKLLIRMAEAGYYEEFLYLAENMKRGPQGFMDIPHYAVESVQDLFTWETLPEICIKGTSKDYEGFFLLMMVKQKTDQEKTSDKYLNVGMIAEITNGRRFSCDQYDVGIFKYKEIEKEEILAILNGTSQEYELTEPLNS